jgi:hypothetical protein
VTNWKDKPFALIGVHVGGLDAKHVKDVAEKEKLSWRSFVDPGSAGAGPIATAWCLTSTPTLYVIDAQGVIRHKWAGAPGEKLIDAALDELIREPEASHKDSPK